MSQVPNTPRPKCACGNVAKRTSRGRFLTVCRRCYRISRGKPRKIPTTRLHPLHRCWLAIKRRCYNKNCQDYADYGGRGIKMCDAWKHDFWRFVSDMGPRPSPLHSIDRFPDNNGNYEPGNCRWATKTEQTRNMRNSRLLTFNGVTRTLPEWAEVRGMPADRLRKRIDRYGWSLERALTT